MVLLLLQQTLSTIEAEQPEIFDRSFLLVDKLIQEYGEENLAERLYNEIPADCPWQAVSGLFAILIWSMSDAGSAALVETTDQWLLEGNNLKKIKIALHIDIYPFRNPQQMREVLSKLADQYSEVAQQCHDFIASRKN